MKNKKELVIYVLVALVLLSITFGISYAYFTATVTGNNSATETRITAGIFDFHRFTGIEKSTDSFRVVLTAEDKKL